MSKRRKFSVASKRVDSREASLGSPAHQARQGAPIPAANLPG